MKHLRILGALMLMIALVAMLAVNLTPSTAPEAMFELGIAEAVDLTVPTYVADIMPEADVGSAVADSSVVIPVTMAALGLVAVAIYTYKLRKDQKQDNSASSTADGRRRPRDGVQPAPAGA